MSQSARFWDKAAQKYAKSPISDQASYERKLADTQDFLTPEMRILEFGCGTGGTAIHHAPKVQHVEAIDISENMLDIARDRAREQSIENIRFTRGTLSEFNADDASMDAVLGLSVIHLLPERQALLAEVARILKPGGVFVSSTVCLGDSYWRLIKPLVPLGKMLGLMPDLYVLKAQTLKHEVTSAGFDIERQWCHGSNDMVLFMIARKR